MLTKKQKIDSFLFFFFIIFISCYLFNKTLEDNILYFLSPTEIQKTKY